MPPLTWHQCVRSSITDSHPQCHCRPVRQRHGCLECCIHVIHANAYFCTRCKKVASRVRSYPLVRKLNVQRARVL
eukprot:352891-Chlamydomonas_euryale.AAC.8